MVLRNVVWAADTNYRIDMENEDVRRLATSDNFDSLLAADQVWRIYLFPVKG